MKTVKFTVYPDGYRCSEPGDQSGEYLKLTNVPQHTQLAVIFRKRGTDNWTVLETYLDSERGLEVAKEMIDGFDAVYLESEMERRVVRLQAVEIL